MAQPLVVVEVEEPKVEVVVCTLVVPKVHTQLLLGDRLLLTLFLIFSFISCNYQLFFFYFFFLGFGFIPGFVSLISIGDSSAFRFFLGGNWGILVNWTSWLLKNPSLLRVVAHYQASSCQFYSYLSTGCGDSGLIDDYSPYQPQTHLI